VLTRKVGGADTPEFVSQSANMSYGKGTAAQLIHGRISALTATSFDLMGIVIQYSPATPLDGSLSEGAKVDVWFTPSGAINQAQIIDVGD